MAGEPFMVRVEPARVCRRCGASPAEDAEHCACGAFLEGNKRAWRHGRYADLDRPDLAALIASKRAEVTEALGGASELSPQKAAIVESFAKVAVLEASAFEEVKKAGLVTARGNARAIFRVWQQLDEALVRRAQALGLERRTKRVPNPADWLEGKA